MTGAARRIVVTGGAGRVGRQVAGALAADGDDVLGLDAREAEPVPGVRFEVATLDRDGALEPLLAGADAVVHLAAMMSWDPRDAAALFRSNVIGTFNLLEACVTAGVRRFVFASSGEVYPESAPVSCPIDESHPRRPTSHYGMTKLLGEELVAYYGRTGLATTVIRLEHTQIARELLEPDSFFSGPRFFLRPRIRRERELGRHHLADLLERHDGAGERLLLLRDPDGHATKMPITDARDVVQGIVRTLRADAAVGQTIAVGPADPVRFEVAVPRMSALTGLDIAEVTVPGPLLRYEVSIAAARRLLGYQPRWTFDAMLDEAAAHRWHAGGRTWTT